MVQSQWQTRGRQRGHDQPGDVVRCEYLGLTVTRFYIDKRWASSRLPWSAVDFTDGAATAPPFMRTVMTETSRKES